MNEKYINPFLQAFVNIMPQFGLTEISRGSVSLKPGFFSIPALRDITGICSIPAFLRARRIKPM